MRLFDSLTGAVQSFGPADSQTVRLYVCGITPYDTTHIGHAFTYLTFDVLNRLCQHAGWNVRYVQNVTDVDDDIMRRARDTGEHWQRLGARHTRQFQEDLAALAVLPPDVYPRASDEIPAILDLIGTLMTSGCAYARKGAVFFRVAADLTYGQFARLTRDEMVTLSAERGADPDDPRKEDPLDFVLWQPSAPDEPRWDSPWGPGRPGWHIECSAMATHHLGPQLDIHGGGGDLIFPHHESEIAQSECATGVRPFARFWVHVAMVRYAGEKMSKSLGNLVLVRDVLRSHSADALRLYLHSHHYRQSFDYRDDGPAAFESLVDRVRQAAALVLPTRQSVSPSSRLVPFVQALSDDLDTPMAVDILRQQANHMLATDDGTTERERETLRLMGSLLGLTSTR